MNIFFLSIIFVAFVTAAIRQFNWNGEGDAPMQQLSTAMIDSAGASVELAIGLVGVMALFLGLMKVAEEGGMLHIIARILHPLMRRLFPDIPADHPAMGAMIMNISANALGLGNAATPFGIRAMQALNTLNRHPGTATDSMVLFLAINTSSVTLLPTGVIALRASAGSADPAAILPTTLMATMVSTVVAISTAMLMRRLFPIRTAPVDLKLSDNRSHNEIPTVDPYPFWVSLTVLASIVALIPLMAIYGTVISAWILPLLMLGFLLFGFVRKVMIYEAFVEGAKDGFDVALKIIPYLVAILVAIGMLRSSGALEIVVNALSTVTTPLGLPGEALPMALLRPLSGSGAYGVMASIINDPAIGPDSYVGMLVTTLQGSTETTFYVLAVYFGAIQIKRIRHALLSALTADFAAIIAAVVAVNWILF